MAREIGWGEELPGEKEERMGRKAARGGGREKKVLKGDFDQTMDWLDTQFAAKEKRKKGPKAFPPPNLFRRGKKGKNTKKGSGAVGHRKDHYLADFHHW